MKSSKPECYGRMFPDLSREVYNEPLEGQAFDVCVERRGWAITDRACTAKLEAWEKCLECGCYRLCYDLGMAKLMLYVAVRKFGVTPAM